MIASPAFRCWRAADIGPTARELKILRRIAEGGLYVSHRNGGLSFAFADGGGAQNNFRRPDFEKFTELRWILPDPDFPPLIPECTAQRYVAAARWLP